MDSNEQLSHDGGVENRIMATYIQISCLETAVRFHYVESELAQEIGVDRKVIVEARRKMERGVHWIKLGRVLRWSEAGFVEGMKLLGLEAVSPVKRSVALSKQAVVSQPVVGERLARVQVTNLNIPNLRLVLGKTERGEAVKVWINPAWRLLFRVGMWIEAEKGGGEWRTRKPRSVGRF